MIGEGAFRAQLARVRDLATELELVEWPNLSAGYPTRAIDAARAATGYRDEWLTYVTGAYYDLLLVDGSLLQFKWKPDQNADLSYCYYDSPIEGVTYKEFVAEMYGVENTESYAAWDDFEQYRSEQPQKPGNTPIRYDYSPQLYRKGVHPASHLHVGYRSEVRLGLERIIQPVGFLLLVVRLAYPLTWESRVLPRPDCNELVRELRDNLEQVEARYLTQQDRWEPLLK